MQKAWKSLLSFKTEWPSVRRARVRSGVGLRHGLRTILVVLFTAGVAIMASAQDAGVARISEVVDDAIVAADTASPRDTLRSFIVACNRYHRLIEKEAFIDRSRPEHRYVGLKIIDCIDVTGLPAFAREEYAAEAAVCIKEILDRVELPQWNEIPGPDDIEAAGGFEKLSRYRIPDTRITIARVESGPNKHEYLFSPGTVERSVDYFQSIRLQPYRTSGPEVSEDFYRWYMSAPGHPAVAAILEYLPEDWRYTRWGGMAAWKWPGLLLSLLVTGVLMYVCYRMQQRVTARVEGKSVLKYCLTIVFPLVASFLPLVLSYFAKRYLTIRGTPLYVIGFAANIVSLLAGVVVVFAASTRVAESIISSPTINPRGLNAQLIRIISKLMSLVISTVLILIGGQYLGIPVATLLASAGIGGLAIALGAQDTLKTLFGTMMLMADKPFRVGERIVFGKYDGSVEDIGLRSTRLRLLTGHQVTVPNDELSRSDIENVTRRPYIRRVTHIHLPLDTPREKVERAVAIVRAAVDNHEGMNADYPPRVFFDEFNEDSFNVRMMYWYHPANYWDFLALNERVNLQIFREFESEGIQFSLPSRITHTSTDSLPAPLDVNLLHKEHGKFATEQ